MRIDGSTPSAEARGLLVSGLDQAIASIKGVLYREDYCCVGIFHEWHVERRKYVKVGEMVWFFIDA